MSIYFESSDQMDCDSVTQPMFFNMSSSGHGGTPTIVTGSIKCLTVDPSTVPPAEIPGVAIRTWRWKTTLNNVHDATRRYFDYHD